MFARSKPRSAGPAAAVRAPAVALSAADRMLALQRTFGNAAITRALLQRLPDDEIHVNSTYQYIDTGGVRRTGKLTAKNHGWYTFDNGFRAHGQNKVVKPSVTVAQIILKAAADRGIDNPILLSLVADFTLGEIKLAKSTGLLATYLGDWSQFTACYDTAVRMFDLLGQGGVVATGTAVRGNAVSVANTCATLGGLIAGMAGQRGIFGMRYGIHGFAIAVADGQAEVVQSFAGAAHGDMLATFLRAGKVYTLAELGNLLTQMGGSVQERARRRRRRCSTAGSRTTRTCIPTSSAHGARRR